MNSLPLELFDIIIGYIDDKESLENCSLVARSWEDPSRKRLFKYIQTPPRSLETWLERISQGRNGTLLEHVHRLTCNDEFSFSLLYQDKPEDGIFCDRFGSLRQLRHLKFRATVLYIWPQKAESVFSALGNTLSRITLWSCAVPKSLVPILINCLPNLEHLCLKDVFFVPGVGGESTLLISRSHLKKLSIGEQNVKSLDFLSELWEQMLRFDEVALLPCGTHADGWTVTANCVIRTFGASAKYLRIPHIPNTSERLTLSPCHELHKLEIMVFEDPLYHEGLELVPSIPSKNIEKIIINYSGSWPMGDAMRMRLDAILSELSERLGHKVGLEFSEGVQDLDDF